MGHRRRKRRRRSDINRVYQVYVGKREDRYVSLRCPRCGGEVGRTGFPEYPVEVSHSFKKCRNCGLSVWMPVVTS